MAKNLVMPQVAGWLKEQLGGAFRSALLCTTTRDWQFISNESGVARLVDHKPSETQLVSQDHDKKAACILDSSAADWLHGLEILDRDGRVRASMADKHRQINHYLEIVSHLAKDCGWLEMPKEAASLHFADMGCGKGYLTFGLWHLFARLQKRPVRVTGVESRPDLVNTTNRLAKQIGANGLEFVQGDIASVKLPPLDALIALHACNTATDEAITRGIELGAKLIVVAPCCHKELRPQLGKPEPLAAVLRHGLMEERMAEWATDGLRALFLEWAGYRTKIMEFVGGEHTPKNLMIAAVREREAFGRHMSAFSNVQDWIAHSRVAIDQARLLLLQTAWRLDQSDSDPQQLRSDVAAVKLVAAQLQTQVVDRAIQMFGAMGLSPDTPLAYFWSWGRAMHLMDGPDEVHLRSIARHALRQSAEQGASLAAYFTTPEQLKTPPQIR